MDYLSKNASKNPSPKKKIRVGFIINYEFNSWLAGINYFRNLIDAIMSLPEREIEPIVIIGNKSLNNLPAEFNKVEVIHTRITDRWSPVWVIRTINKMLFNCDLILDQFLKKNQIDVLSHAALMYSYIAIPKICWIPDFQHRRLKNFFTASQISTRDKKYKKLCEKSTGIILSSKDAQKDLKAFYPEAVKKSYVLNFIAKLSEGYEKKEFYSLKKKYNINQPFFHLPNQFWAHKNHILVIEALNVLKQNGINILVVVTGNPSDPRKSGFVSKLFAKIDTYDISDCFKVLGVVPYEDLISLMWHSVAIINPSLFEGWSSTVEESKSMGKKIVLSDIAVHREQNPERGVFVDPYDPAKMAKALQKVMDEFDAQEEKNYTQRARENFLSRIETFGGEYQEIVLKIYEESRSSITNFDL